MSERALDDVRVKVTLDDSELRAQLEEIRRHGHSMDQASAREARNRGTLPTRAAVGESAGTYDAGVQDQLAQMQDRIDTALRRNRLATFGVLAENFRTSRGLPVRGIRAMQAMSRGQAAPAGAVAARAAQGAVARAPSLVAGPLLAAGVAAGTTIAAGELASEFAPTLRGLEAGGIPTPDFIAEFGERYNSFKAQFLQPLETMFSAPALTRRAMSFQGVYGFDVGNWRTLDEGSRNLMRAQHMEANMRDWFSRYYRAQEARFAAPDYKDRFGKYFVEIGPGGAPMPKFNPMDSIKEAYDAEAKTEANRLRDDSIREVLRQYSGRRSAE